MNGAARDRLTIALSKGKLLEPSLDLFYRVGLIPKKTLSEGRRLVFEHPPSRTTIMIIRPSDVPTYVEHGAVDAGIVGADVLMEQTTDVYEPLDLGFGGCRLAVAAPDGSARETRRTAVGSAKRPSPNLMTLARGRHAIGIVTGGQ